MTHPIQDEVPEAEPFRRFESLLQQAHDAGLPEPTAMSVATVTPDGKPSVRMILLKGVDERGFVFYTNMNSPKARDLAANPHAALCFFWASLEIQVRVDGPAERLGVEEADAYFASRPRGSQIGAWASRQSEVLADRSELERKIEEFAVEFGDGPIPRPENWSGYRVVPERFEFWFGRPSRLHDRELFTRSANGWSMQRLYP
jgi:pyridoxamine 5'-phosphate oxidase